MKTNKLKYLRKIGKNRRRARTQEMLTNSTYLYMSKGL